MQLLYVNAVCNKAAAIKVTDDIISVITDNPCLLCAQLFFFFFFFHLYFIEALCILMDKASRRASVSMAYKGRSSHHAVTTHTFPASREDALNDLA